MECVGLWFVPYLSVPYSGRQHSVEGFDLFGYRVCWPMVCILPLPYSLRQHSVEGFDLFGYRVCWPMVCILPLPYSLRQHSVEGLTCLVDCVDLCISCYQGWRYTIMTYRWGYMKCTPIGLKIQINNMSCHLSTFYTGCPRTFYTQKCKILRIFYYNKDNRIWYFDLFKW